MTTATTLQQIVQVSTALNAAEHPDAADQARQLILDWVEARSGLPITSDIRNGANAELGDSTSGYSLEILGDDKLWAMRYEQSDELGRNWRADATITTSGLTPMLKTRLTCLRDEKSESCPSVLPGFIFKAAKNIGLKDAGLFTGRDPITIKTQPMLFDMLDLLKNPARKLPVIVISQIDRFQPTDASKESGYLVDGKKLALSMAGIAHVVLLPATFTWTLSNHLSRPYSVYNGGVRIYAPNVNPDVDHKSRHILFPADTIRQTASPKAFFNSLIQQTYNQSVQSMDSQESVPSFTNVKEYFQQKNEKNILAERETMANERKELRAFAKGLEERALKAEQNLQGSQEDIGNLLRFARQMRQERDAALSASGQWKATSLEMSYPFPKSIADVGEWIAAHLPHRVEITSRAVREAQRCAFKDVGQFYRSILLLATHYYDTTIRKDPTAAPLLDEEKKKLGVDINKQFAANKKSPDPSLLAHTPSGTYPLDRVLQSGRTSNPERLLHVQFCTAPNGRIVIGGFVKPNC